MPLSPNHLALYFLGAWANILIRKAGPATWDECQLLGYLDKGKRKRKEKAGSLQWAYMAIARLGGFMDSKRTGIASWGALW